METLGTYLPFWEKLDPHQQELLVHAVGRQNYPRGALLHGGGADCVGLLLVLHGQLRVYTVSSEGKELTLYRLLERDLCLFSASCILNSIQFDVFVTAEQPTEILHIPAELYQSLMRESAAVAGYTNELMASRFSEVMWLMDQILNQKIDTRLAALLLEERALAGSDELTLTHEQLANHLGSAREVVTRMLKYFQSEGLVQLGRGRVTLRNLTELSRLAQPGARM